MFSFRTENLKNQPARFVEFDDLETFEHSKYKPLSITLAVESGTRRILGLEVSTMPAKGHLAVRARARYGHRQDARPMAREILFTSIKDLLNAEPILKSDCNPHYPNDVARFLPSASHQLYQGKRGSQSGQGELKKVRFDPLFSLNHTCAMFRANVNRLFRKTWCTTKRPDRLWAHLILYANYHNKNLTN
jgi:hypothetical protein